MTLRTRLLVSIVALAVLLAAGEFVGSRVRSRGARQVEPRDAGPLGPHEYRFSVLGPDGLPVPRGWARHPETHAREGGGGGGGGWGTFSDGTARAGYDPRSADPANGERWVEVWGAADRHGAPLPFGAALLGPLPPEPREIAVLLPRETVLRGRILRAGAPLPGVRVRARLSFPGNMAWQGWEDRERCHGEGVTGPDGTFAAGGLGRGPHRVWFEGPPGVAIADRDHDPADPLEIDLEPAGKDGPDVTVADGAGRGVPGREVRVLVGRKGHFAVHDVVVAAGTTGPEGRIRFLGLDPGRSYVLDYGQVRGKAFRDDFRMTIPTWRPADKTVSLVQAEGGR